jgi:hypothetical protein
MSDSFANSPGTFSYFIPTITIAPPPDYELAQVVPAGSLRAGIAADDTDLIIRRDVVIDGQITTSSEEVLSLRNGAWRNSDALEFRLASPGGSDWVSGRQVGYLETKITTASGDPVFRGNQFPNFYLVFASPVRKSFFLDQKLKFADPVTIRQIAAYGTWVEGHPACVVDARAGYDVSAILINPFERPAVVTFAFEGRAERPRRKIEPLSGQRVSFADLLGHDRAEWSGQVYISGRNRVLTWIAFHTYDDPRRVTTIEHTDAFRGGVRRFPFTQALHAHRALNALLSDGGR